MATLNTPFTEEQKFTQTWLWILLILAYLSPFTIKFNSIIENGFWGTFSPGILAHITTLGMIILLFALMKLKTQVNTTGIHLHFFPFIKRHFKWEEIEEAKSVRYTLLQTGGWGIRLWTKYGTVYNIKGKKGVFVRLKNGKKYLIGTQHPESFIQGVQQNLIKGQ